MEYETRSVAYVVLPKDEKLFSELATEIKIVDEAAGEFVTLDQSGSSLARLGVVNISPEEWPFIRSAIDSLIQQCRDEK